MLSPHEPADRIQANVIGCERAHLVLSMWSGQKLLEAWGFAMACHRLCESSFAIALNPMCRFYVGLAYES